MAKGFDYSYIISFIFNCFIGQIKKKLMYLGWNAVDFEFYKADCD